MAIKRARLKYHNGTDFDTYHYETQAGQVKVYDDSGNEIASLNDLVFQGKSVDGANINTLTSTGLYRVTNPINAPITVTKDEVYLVDVKATNNSAGAKLSFQTFITSSKLFNRLINGNTIGSWLGASDSVGVANQVNTNVGSVSSLNTSVKTNIVNAINGLQAEVNANETAIKNNASSITQLNNNLVSHNHDTTYLKLSGGDLTGDASFLNGKGVKGKNSGGTALNLAMIDTSNRAVLGNTSIATVIQASGGNLTLSDGTATHKVWHAGNDGVNSGLDADLLDGVQGSSYARKDTDNVFTKDQYVTTGRSIVLQASSGSSQAGSLYFRDGNGGQKGVIQADAGGNLIFWAGNVSGHRFSSDGRMYSTYDHEFNTDSREVRSFFSKWNDRGIGHYMGTSGQFGLYDWQHNASIFQVDRGNQTVNFPKWIKVQGRNLFIQPDAPQPHGVGDVWIDI